MASYSKHRNFPPALQRDIRRYFRYFFSGNTNAPYAPRATRYALRATHYATSRTLTPTTTLQRPHPHLPSLTYTFPIHHTTGKTALPEQEILSNMSASLRIEVSAFDGTFVHSHETLDTLVGWFG